MRRIIPILLLLNICSINGQSFCDYFCQDFEDNECLDQLIIDTVDYPDNLWQIGKPQKQIINHASTPFNVIITDTINSYPVNNTSVFDIKYIASEGDKYGLRIFAGNYIAQTDSLKDFGKMEFSPDNGSSWIDILNDKVPDYNIIWNSPIPVLTGKPNEWKYFDFMFADNGSVFDIEVGDTLIIRFSFISDSVFDDLDGIAFDNLCFYDFVEGISEAKFKYIKSKIYPNPSTEIFTIAFENPRSDPFQLSIYDAQSRLLYTQENIADDKILVNAMSFRPGIYFYKLTNPKVRERSWGKFIVNE